MRHSLLRPWQATPIAVLIVLLFLLAASAGCEQRRQQDKVPPTKAPAVYRGTIVAVGDSLTAGKGVAEEQAYPAQLQKKLQENGYPYRVINAGISGETSSGALSRINWILTTKPDIVILETGANDGLRGIPTKVIEDNLRQIIHILRQNKVVVVLAGMQMVRNLGQQYTEAFAAIYPAVARQEKVILIPFFLQGVAAAPSLNQEDTIHPTGQGYQVVVDTVYPYVLQAIKTLLGNRRTTEPQNLEPRKENSKTASEQP